MQKPARILVLENSEAVMCEKIKKMTFSECGDIMKLNKSTERSTKLGHKNIAEHHGH